MPETSRSSSHHLRPAAIVSVATLVAALFAWCSVADEKRRLWTGIDKCMAMRARA